jgi:acetylornithine deacetylase/succinyl-diaminopimelate desuccinylase family protein
MADTSLQNDVVALVREFVGIPSVNPQLADDAAIAGEHRMAHHLSSWLDRRGFLSRFVEKTPGRPNLVATYPCSNPRRRLIIEAHLDTQGIHGMTVPPFGGEIRDGRIFGRGACDMKGPMAAALVNLTKERMERLAAAGVEVIFIAAIGEETGNIGALELVRDGVGADEILVLEPTDLHVVHAHKGAFWFEVEVKGIAAHGSNPDKGLSAICAMTKVIALVQSQTAAVEIENPVLGRATANIGKIHGGTSINIVPETCVIQVDRRTVPGEDSGQIISRLKEALAVMKQAGDLADFDVRIIKEGKPFETNADSRLVNRLCESCAGLGVTPVTEGAAWYSDAGPFAATCREVAVFGPGSIRQAHTADEFIEIDELVKGAQIIGDFLDRLAQEMQ